MRDAACLGIALLMVFFEVWGPFFFAVNVLSEALFGSISLDIPGKTTLLTIEYGGQGGVTVLLVQTFLVNQ